MGIISTKKRKRKNNWLLFLGLFTAANPTIPKIPKELLDEYMAYYLKECQNCKMIDVTTNEDGKKCAQLNTTMFVVHATKL